MKSTQLSIVGGLLLVALGGLLLAQTLGVIVFDAAGVFALIFAAGGIVFLGVYAGRRDQWWPLIPGFTLLAIGVLLSLEWLAPRLAEILGGSIVLAGISLAFWGVYFSRRDYWWALIPAGVLLTIALAIALEQVVSEDTFLGVFFLGLGATFGILHLVPRAEGRMTWPLIPAAVLAVMGVIFTAIEVSLFGYLWPAALMVVGVYILVRALRRS